MAKAAPAAKVAPTGNPFLTALKSSDVQFALGIIAVIFTMFIPLPPFLLDMLPYLVTIAVVGIWGRAKPFTIPAGLREVFAGTSK